MTEAGSNLRAASLRPEHPHREPQLTHCLPSAPVLVSLPWQLDRVQNGSLLGPITESASRGTYQEMSEWG